MKNLIPKNTFTTSTAYLWKRIIFIEIAAIFCIGLSSCEELINKNFYNTPTAKLVVDALITNKDGESYVKLSLPATKPNEVPQAVSDALVLVTDGTNTEIVAEEELQPGLYKPAAGKIGVSGKIYMIYIQAGDFIDSAFTYILPVTPLGEFKTQADEPNPGYFFISGENSDNSSMIRYTVIPPGCNQSDSCRVEFSEFKLSSFDIPQIFSPNKDDTSFPIGSTVIRKKYSINPEYESYIRAMLSETEWRGGLFDVQAGNPKGNFGENTLGFFAGCSLAMETVVIE